MVAIYSCVIVIAISGPATFGWILQESFNQKAEAEQGPSVLQKRIS